MEWMVLGATSETLELYGSDEKQRYRLSYSVIRLHPVADKIARFCACFR